MKKITLTGIVGYTLLGFAGWVGLRGVGRVFMWAVNEPYTYGQPVVFGPWEMLGTAILSAFLGLIIYKFHEEGRRNDR